VVTGLIAGEAGYTALVAEDPDDEDFAVWTSPNGIDWTQRATEASVFDLLAGKSGFLYTSLTGPPAAEPQDDRPIAFSFNGYWLEIPLAYEGERLVTVAVAADGRRRIASGITGSGDDVRVHLLVADP
jgi:hypothetical protein